MLVHMMWWQGDLAGARELLGVVLEAYGRTRSEDHRDLLAARLTLATMTSSQGDLADVRKLQEAVLEAHERMRSPEDTCILYGLLDLAFTMLEQGELAEASELANKVAQGMLEQLSWAGSALSRREARSVVEGAAFWHEMLRLLSSSVELAAPDQMRFELVESMRYVANLDLGPGVEATPTLVKLRAEIISVRGRLGDLVAASLSGECANEVIADEVTRLTARRDKLERQLRAEIVRQGAFLGSIRAPEVARGLPSDAVAIGFLRTRDWTQIGVGRFVSQADVLSAHALFPNGSLVEIELGEAEKLEELARNWREALESSLPRARGRSERGGVSIPATETGGDELSAWSLALREGILDPVLAELGKETKTLFVCPADFLHAVPLEALPLDGGLVGDRYRIVNQVSLRRFVAPAAPLACNEGPELLAIGHVAYGAEPQGPAMTLAAVSAQIDSATRSSHKELPETRDEVEGIDALFQETFGRASRLLIEDAATKAALHQFAPGVRFLHVATHGWFKEVQFPEPRPGALWTPLGARETLSSLAPMSFCGLALAGANHGRDSLGRVPGILTAEELAGMDLSSCELAVLSACETNVGIRSAGSGIESLQSGLHAAGVRTAITSLWKVDDYWTKELMLEFYRRIWVEGQPKAQALWDSKMAMRARRAETRHWAAWVLSGDPE